MSRDDIQKLLGGYATGTLTPEEQQTLFAAALEDQELFDALAREEPLREVLSDPSARAQLLAALDEMPAPWYRRWLRPGPIAALATVVLVGIGVAVWQSSRAPRPRRMAVLELPQSPSARDTRSQPLLPPPPEVKRAAPDLAPFSLPGGPPVAPPPQPAAAAAPAPVAESKAALSKDAAPAVIGAVSGGFGPPMQQMQQSAGQQQTRFQALPQNGRFVPSAGNSLLEQTNVPLHGVVTDASGAGIRSASVVVRSAATGQVSTASTDEHGEFNASAVPGSNYQISASAPGFRSATLTGAAPALGTPEPVSLKLDVGATAEAVEVTAATSAVMPMASGGGGAGRGGFAGLARTAAAKTKKASDTAVQYQLMRRMPDGDLQDVTTDKTVPAGVTLILRITPKADGDLRIVESGRTIASHAVRRGEVFETQLPKFDQPGRVELQVYFSADKLPSLTITLNIQ